jgi:hypothetical protein
MYEQIHHHHIWLTSSPVDILAPTISLRITFHLQFVSLKSNSLAKTTMGQKWYQSIALTSLLRPRYFFSN